MEAVNDDTFWLEDDRVKNWALALQKIRERRLLGGPDYIPGLFHGLRRYLGIICQGGHSLRVSNIPSQFMLYRLDIATPRQLLWHERMAIERIVGKYAPPTSTLSTLSTPLVG